MPDCAQALRGVNALLCHCSKQVACGLEVFGFGTRTTSARFNRFIVGLSEVIMAVWYLTALLPFRPAQTSEEKTAPKGIVRKGIFPQSFCQSESLAV
eukprot:312107-Amphidinium_carterae.1